jgi:hypothetical protein
MVLLKSRSASLLVEKPQPVKHSPVLLHTNMHEAAVQSFSTQLYHYCGAWLQGQTGRCDGFFSEIAPPRAHAPG